MIKKSFRLMLLVAFALSSVMFVSCNKYDDDIERIDNELAALNATVTSLKAAVDGGAVISSVSNTTDGVKFTLSNGQSYTVNHGTAGKDGLDGKDGQNGKDGQDGKNGSVVTIGENGNWFIDDVDQGINATQPYVVNNGAWYSLYVMEQVDGANAEVIEVKLPTTGSITDIKVVGINSANAIVAAPTVELNYGKTYTGSEKVEFGDKTYSKTTLFAAGSSLTAMVNPLDADAALYNFSLVDSKGNTYYTVGNAKQHMSEKAITKADPTPNKGLWTMDVAFADGIDLGSATKRANRVAAAYALTTTTMNGTVASAYDVKVVENYVSAIGFTKFNNPAAVNVGKSIDLTASLKSVVGGVVIKNGSSSSFTDMTPYIVAHKFEVADKTSAAAKGAVVDGDKLTATSYGDVAVKVSVLLVTGQKFTETITATFNYVAPEGTLTNVEWTISDKSGSNVVYLPLGDLQASLVGSMDTQLPSVSVLGWTWADGKKFTEKNIVINGVQYGKKDSNSTLTFDAYDLTASMPVVGGLYYVDNKGNYQPTTSSTKIQTPLYVAFTFDHTDALPGEFIVKLGVKKGGNTTANNDFEVPVSVKVTAPTVSLLRNEKYFEGNDVTVYSELKNIDASGVWYNLDQLYSTKVSNFVEKTYKDSNNKAYKQWLQTGSHVILVPTYSYADKADHFLTVYATREYTANVIPFNNKLIEATADTFNLTVKSPIKEGTFSSEATKVVNGKEVVEISLADFVAKDVYGESFNIASTFAYDSVKEVYTTTVDKAKDARIAKVEIAATGDNKQYISVGTAFENPAEPAASQVIKVKRSNEATAMTSDAECTVTVTITDAWGVKSEATVKVTIKK